VAACSARSHIDCAFSHRAADLVADYDDWRARNGR